MTGSLPAMLVEAFAAGPLQGNGAAVVLLETPAESAWMQALAASLQQSETAFLHQGADGGWRLRWFTPRCEVPLCGHATLAATVALQHWGHLQAGASLRLATRSGGLAVSLRPQQRQQPVASLVLPSGPLQPLPVPPQLTTLLATQPLAYWASALGYRVALLPESLPLEALPCISPQLQGADRGGLVLMQACPDSSLQLLGGPCDYQLRFFAPDLGIEEDPVTGSAHALVAPWWMQHLGRSTVRGWQPSRRHGGMLCEAAEPGFVRLTGFGHLLWDGQINAPGSGSDPDGWMVCSSA